jgi:hypothetical protein
MLVLTKSKSKDSDNKEVTSRSFFFFITTLYILTILISAGDTYNYFINDYGVLKWVNLGLNITISAVLPFFLLGKINDKIATGIVVYLTVLTIFYTNYYFLETKSIYWEQNYLRDIPILFVYMFSMCLTLSNKHLIFLNSIHILYCIGIAWRSDSAYIDENTIIIISSLIGFSIIMHTFLRLLYDSISARKEIEKQMATDNEKRLKSDIGMKDRELTLNALTLVYKAEASNEVVTQLKELNKKLGNEVSADINRIISSVNFTEKNDIWEEFQLRFIEVHPSFSKKLIEEYPALTKGDIKLASLLRLDLSSKKIAMLTGNTRESVDVSRSRLRKKMNLTSLDNIVSVLSKY